MISHGDPGERCLLLEQPASGDQSVPLPGRLTHHVVHTCPLRGAAAVVGIDPVHANPSVLASVVRAVIYIPLTGAAFKTW